MKTSLEIVSLVGPLILFSFEGATINTFFISFLRVIFSCFIFAFALFPLADKWY